MDQVLAHLAGRGVAAALIGGMALAAHGIARSTEDIDFLVLDRAVLKEDFWQGWDASAVDLRRGDPEDPLAGVVRLKAPGAVVDLVVGRQAWLSGVLDRRTEIVLGTRRLPVVRRADLVLLKLLAGGPQDHLDVQLLLAADSGELRAEVERQVAQRPALAETWSLVLQQARA